MYFWLFYYVNIQIKTKYYLNNNCEIISLFKKKRKIQFFKWKNHFILMFAVPICSLSFCAPLSISWKNALVPFNSIHWNIPGFQPQFLFVLKTSSNYESCRTMKIKKLWRMKVILCWPGIKERSFQLSFFRWANKENFINPRLDAFSIYFRFSSYLFFLFWKVFFLLWSAHLITIIPVHLLF